MDCTGGTSCVRRVEEGRAGLIMSGLVDNAVLLFGAISERLVRTLVLGLA